MLWFLLLLSALLILAYKLLASNYTYWQKRGVPHLPVSMLFGNTGDSLMGKKSLGQLFADIYNVFPNHAYVGFYQVRNPGVIVRDPELIKEVLIRDFKRFHDNVFYIDEKTDPIFAKNLFALRGDQWKESKSQLSSCFTNKKLKTLFPLMDEVGKNMVKYLTDSQENNKADGFEAKELAKKFTTDLIAICTFGMVAHSFHSTKGELNRMIEQMFDQSTLNTLKHVCMFIVPSLGNFLQVRIFTEPLTQYIRNIVRQTLAYRESNQITQGDFLDLMRRPGFTEDDLTAHTGGLFGDGVETSSIALSYTLYELAANTDVQDTLRTHVNEMLLKNENRLDFDSILALEYLDNILQETLRLHTPFPYMAKICTETTQWPSPFGEGKGPNVTLTKGMPIFIPVQGIHLDPNYYPNPEQFRPERFSSGNKSNSLFLSFGGGPRRCLGERLAHIQIKIAIVYLVAHFDVSVNRRTKVPLEIDPKYFLLAPKDGIYLNFTKLVTC